MTTIIDIILSDRVKSRFWGYVPDRPENGCWIWAGSRGSNGYAKFYFAFPDKGRRFDMHASRVSLIMATKAIPDGKYALHSCDNPVCVNPSHLRWGSLAENMSDCMKRGRIAKGVTNGNSKLTEADVRAIMADHRPSRAVAKDFGINKSTVLDIRNRLVWCHVE